MLYYRVFPPNLLSRCRLRTRTQELNAAFQSTCNNETSTLSVTNGNIQNADNLLQSNTPIKLIKKTNPVTSNNTTTSNTNLNHCSLQKSLQKQVSYTEPFAPINHQRNNSTSENPISSNTI